MQAAAEEALAPEQAGPSCTLVCDTGTTRVLLGSGRLDFVFRAKSRSCNCVACVAQNFESESDARAACSSAGFPNTDARVTGP